MYLTISGAGVTGQGPSARSVDQFSDLGVAPGGMLWRSLSMGRPGCHPGPTNCGGLRAIGNHSMLTLAREHATRSGPDGTNGSALAPSLWRLATGPPSGHNAEDDPSSSDPGSELLLGIRVLTI